MPLLGVRWLVTAFRKLQRAVALHRSAVDPFSSAADSLHTSGQDGYHMIELFLRWGRFWNKAAQTQKKQPPRKLPNLFKRGCSPALHRETMPAVENFRGWVIDTAKRWLYDRGCWVLVSDLAASRVGEQGIRWKSGTVPAAVTGRH